MISIRQVLTGEPIRLRYIKCFSICPRVHEESVAEHSFYVAFIAMMLAEVLKKSGHKINVGLLLSRALIHDLDEVFSGDFIRMFKHHNEPVKIAIEATSRAMMEGFVKDYPAGAQLMEYWQTSKAQDIEGYILAYADYLSVLSYIWQEINAGNHAMLNQVDEMAKFSNTFNDTKYDMLKEYHVEAAQILKELINLKAKRR